MRKLTLMSSLSFCSVLFAVQFALAQNVIIPESKVSIPESEVALMEEQAFRNAGGIDETTTIIVDNDVVVLNSAGSLVAQGGVVGQYPGGAIGLVCKCTDYNLSCPNGCAGNPICSGSSQYRCYNYTEVY